MRSEHLAGLCGLAWLRVLPDAPRRDERPILRQLDDAVAAGRTGTRRVTVCDEDLAARVDDDIGRPAEGCRARRVDPGLTSVIRSLPSGVNLKI